ncbi:MULTISPECIES: hypothetical protein [Micromonospora]|uniref:Uncharacterized protein n=1 Tax=Micromonospora solifontis TaxID=2487138 RepID=A0ABX9WKU5_9ACTN|nr:MULTISPECIES: hypothetical protein [Micromonospora]NES14603.1 hypothetical protein [Micromonospora sp. PPF5-17B]NES35259.1 hypothetical protein [Micromonospora solifontis]RNM00986.1 hypothetical protein EFE23_03650 [Micromonospora solifontis]
MERETQVILACPPTNINELLAGMGVPEYVPSVDHSLAQCADCGTDMWVGPNQQAAASRASGVTLLLCMTCSIAETHRRSGPAALGHLGGGGGRPRLPS